MPELSRFFGIVIAMYHNDHAPPHFHARYGEYRAKFNILTGEKIDGKMPPRVLALVREWREIHVQELVVDWQLSQNRQPPLGIAPLE